MKDCDNCNHSETWAYAVPCSNCYGASNWEEIKHTNADRIRAMSDEELARFMAHYDSDTRASEYLAEKRWLEWLREETDHDAD